MSRNLHQSKQSCDVSRPTKTGEVGIFWFITSSEILQDSVPFTEGEDDGDFINGPSGHYEYWESLKLKMPVLHSVEYDRVPRGRVVFIKIDETFVVYSSNGIVSCPAKREILMEHFNLKLCKVRFTQDDHYELNFKLHLGITS